jgi:hypothetical protein
VLCHGAGFAIFERLFDVSAKELLLYGRQNTGFSKSRLIGSLCRMYGMCHAARAGGEAAASIAGKFKRQYKELPKITLHGLGAYPWYAKSGFCGVTAVYYCPDVKRALNFASTMPVESEAAAVKGIEQMWRSKSAWNLAASMGSLAKGELSLLGSKISDNGRLSSSEHTTATLVKPQTGFPIGNPVVFDNYEKIKELFSDDPLSVRSAYAVLKVSGISDGRFDKVSQSYYTRLHDQTGNNLQIKIAYSKINETAILNFEYMAQNKITPDAVTVSITIPDEGNEAEVFPIALWINGEIINSGDEKLFDDKAKSEYSKFFEGL